MAKSAKWVTLVPIKNMGRALRFYTKKLGGKLLMRAPGEMKESWASLRLGASELWLIAPERRESRKLAYNALVVPNIRTFVARLRRRGVRFDRGVKMSSESRVDGPITFESFGAMAFLKDSEGNLLMVWQDSSGS